MPMLDLSGFTLTFAEEFNTRSISQPGQGATWANIRSEWRYDANSDIGFGSASFVDAGSGYDPFSVHDGILTITAVPDRTSAGHPGAWESGLLTTQGTFSQTYGYFEIRADFSNIPGAWDAFWLLPDNIAPDSAGHWQELDIVEHYGGADKSLFSRIHTTDPGPNQNWQDNLQVYSELSNPDGFHTYGMEWNQDTISFYVDGQLVGSKPTPSDMHGPMYLLLDLATQSNPGNNVNAAGGSISSYIDYVRVYAKNPAAPVEHPNTGSVGTIGSGPNELVLSLSQDRYDGDAQYTVWVDGVQIGGVQSAQASHAAGQHDTLTVRGSWSGGPHQVEVVFLNDAWGGTSETDRNLYLDGATFNGTAVTDAAHAFLSAGGHQFTLAAPATAPNGGTAATIGSGPDELVLSVSQDAYDGDAQYTVLVDGVQIGGVQTAHASHATGQSDPLTVRGAWGAGPHQVEVVFLNDAWGGTSETDRNLYLDGATFNGAAVTDASHTFLSAGGHQFTLVASETDPGLVVGSGPDKLVLSISQDAYAGDAEYTIWVDGVQIGGVQSAHASHAEDLSDRVTVRGDWGSGSHAVELVFLNDAYAGTPETDRNLYLDAASYNGAEIANAEHALLSAGAHHFSFLDL